MTLQLTWAQIQTAATKAYNEGRLLAQSDQPDAKYRGKNGCPCAIGAAIPDEDYDPNWEGEHILNLMATNKIDIVDDYRKAIDLQQKHDSWAIAKGKGEKPEILAKLEDQFLVALELTTPQVLNRAADLIENTGWTRRFCARDSKGNPIDPASDEAVCFCTTGAIYRVLCIPFLDELMVYTQHPILWAVAMHLADVVPDPDYRATDIITAWNDKQGRTKEEVVAMLREAAKA